MHCWTATDARPGLPWVVRAALNVADLAFRTTKQEQWNQQAQDWQAHQNYLEEHRGIGRFSCKYAPQPQQTGLIWTMPWGCWVELEDKDVHCKEWECIIENLLEIIIDLPIGFPINNIISLGMYNWKLHRGGSGHHSASNLWSACNTQR